MQAILLACYLRARVLRVDSGFHIQLLWRTKATIRQEVKWKKLVVIRDEERIESATVEPLT